MIYKLKTERLLLRPLKIADAEDVLEGCKDHRGRAHRRR